MDIHAPALIHRHPKRSSTKKYALAAVPGLLAGIGATTWALMRRRARPTEQAAKKAQKKARARKS